MNILTWIKPALYHSPFAWAQYMSFNWIEHKLTLSPWAYALSSNPRDKTNEQRGKKKKEKRKILKRKQIVEDAPVSWESPAFYPVHAFLNKNLWPLWMSLWE